MTRGIGGTGLGLYICSELVERMGGRIWVESREPRAARFLFELPSVAGQRPVAKLRDASAKRPPHRLRPCSGLLPRSRSLWPCRRAAAAAFPFGVAAGEMRSDSAILWTSVARPGTVWAEVSADRRFRGMPAARVRMATTRVGGIVARDGSPRSLRAAATGTASARAAR